MCATAPATDPAPLLAQRSRDSLVVSSKGGTLTGQAGASGAQRRDFSVAAIRASCQASLRNLGLDYLDICQPHGASEHDINDDLLLAMQRLRERGLIRHTGINTHSASTLHWMIANPDVFDGVLLDYNALQSAMASAPQSLIFTCRGRDCGSLGGMKKPSASSSLSC